MKTDFVIDLIPNTLLKKTFQGKLEGLVVCKPNDRDLLRNFESALRFGKPILLENVGEDIDPALDPVLKVRSLFFL